jgi:hypothetical protein
MSKSKLKLPPIRSLKDIAQSLGKHVRLQFGLLSSEEEVMWSLVPKKYTNSIKDKQYHVLVTCVEDVIIVITVLSHQWLLAICPGDAAFHKTHNAWKLCATILEERLNQCARDRLYMIVPLSSTTGKCHVSEFNISSYWPTCDTQNQSDIAFFKSRTINKIPGSDMFNVSDSLIFLSLVDVLCCDGVSLDRVQPNQIAIKIPVAPNSSSTPKLPNLILPPIVPLAPRKRKIHTSVVPTSTITRLEPPSTPTRRSDEWLKAAKCSFDGIYSRDGFHLESSHTTTSNYAGYPLAALIEVKWQYAIQVYTTYV